MNSIEILEHEIADLLTQVEIRRNMIRTYKLGMQKAGDPGLRFFEWRPIDAIKALLEENGGPMRRKDLEAAMIRGGIEEDRTRGAANARISFEKNLENGNLIEEDGLISYAGKTRE